MTERKGGTRHPRGIESRLILYSLGLALLFLASLVGVSFFTLRGFLRANLTETTSYRLRIAMEYVDRDADRLAQIMDWSTVSGDVVDYLSASGADESSLKLKALAAYYPIRDAVFSSGLDAFVDKFIVSGRDGRTIQLGLVQGDRGDAEAARAEALGIMGGGPSLLKAEPFSFSRGASMIPFARAIQGDAGRDGALGFSFMAVNPAIVTRFLQGLATEKGTRLFITIGGAPHEIVRGRVETGACPDFPVRSLVSFRGERTGWVLSQTLPTVQLTRQNTIFALLLALMAGAMALFAALLLLMVDRTFNRPVGLIARRVALVSKGDFSRDPAIEWPNELGDIGRAVNGMSRDIEALIEKRVESEKARKDLEFRMLQSQINPHFLYNTLGTIKWMAEIQKAPGIAEVVDSLAALLRHAALGAEGFITLERELELVGEYCLIQRYRSANLFKLRVSVEDESLMDCLVPKFMLQPIVENAILHGIAPKLEPGTVTIEAEPGPGGLFRVSVTDDGVGVEPGRIRQALEGGPSDKEAFNRIGLRNVDERIRLAFGPDCGLSMESEVGAFTRVTMTIQRRTAPAPQACAPASQACAPESRGEAACTRS